MADPDVRSPAMQAPGDIHQAAEIAGQQGIGAGGNDIVDLGVDHAPGNIRVLDAKQAAETATGFAFRGFGQGHSLDLGEQRPGLFLDPHLAQGRA